MNNIWLAIAMMCLFGPYITIRVDTTNYTYIDIDRPLVQEGQKIAHVAVAEVPFKGSSPRVVHRLKNDG